MYSFIMIRTIFSFTNRGLRLPIQRDRVWKNTSFNWIRVGQCRDFNGGLVIVWASLNFPKPIPIFILLWGWLELPDQVQLQASKFKMEDGETEVTEPGWWLGLTRYQVYKMFESVRHKTHEPNEGWLSFCRNCVLRQIFSVFEFERVPSPSQACYALYNICILV